MDFSVTDFEFLRRLVRERAGIVLGDDKRYLIEHRLQSVAERNACRSIGDLVALLRNNTWSDVHRQVVEMMTTNETYFFRDGQPFEAFAQLVIPQLMKAHEGDRQITLWCAACSTGQEPYSLLMVLRDRFPSLANWKVQLIATDINAEVLSRARAGRYTTYEVGRGLSPTLLSRFFSAEGSDYVVKNELRQAVEFRLLNLLDPWNLPTVDVVFMRNVLIYFDLDTKRAILNKVRKYLQAEGFLFLGGAETTLNIDDHFERVAFERAGLYRLKPGAAKYQSGMYPALPG